MPDSLDQPILCQCCRGEREVLAVRRGNILVIRARRHGQDHIALVPMDEHGQGDHSLPRTAYPAPRSQHVKD